MRRFRPFGVLIGLALFAVASVQAQDLFLTGGFLVDPATEQISEQNLLIRDGLIVAQTQAPADFDGETIDITGKYVIPGLRDLHVHSMANVGPRGQPEILGTEAASRRMLYAGVAGFVDLFNLEKFVLPLRDRQRRGETDPGAEIFAAGPCITAPGGHCTEYGTPTRTVETPEEARREVAALAQKQPDVIKVVYGNTDKELVGKTWRPQLPTLDQATMKAVVEAANEHGIPTVFHIKCWQDVVDVVEAGASAITHLPSYGEVPPGLAETMAEKGVFVIPTLAVGDLSMSVDPEFLERPLLQEVTTPEMVEFYRQVDLENKNFQNYRNGMKESQALRFAALKKLADAGVPVGAGTDGGNPGTLFGFSLHHELQLMVEKVGLDPWRALASSTTSAGDFLGRSYGLNEGDEGSVVVLDASPIDDIRNTEQIHLVVHHGVVVDREALLAAGAPRTELLGYIWARTLSMSAKEIALLVGVLLFLAGVFLCVRLLLRRRRSRVAGRLEPQPA